MQLTTFNKTHKFLVYFEKYLKRVSQNPTGKTHFSETFLKKLLCYKNAYMCYTMSKSRYEWVKFMHVSKLSIPITLVFEDPNFNSSIK